VSRRWRRWLAGAVYLACIGWTVARGTAAVLEVIGVAAGLMLAMWLDRWSQR